MEEEAGEGMVGDGRGKAGVGRTCVVEEVLSSELLCRVLAVLPHAHVFLAIEVCHKWRNLAAGLEEFLPDTGAVNWPAFKYLGVLRQKRHSCVIKCESRTSGKQFVVKRIKTRVCPSTGEPLDLHLDQGFPVRYLREVGLLRAAADHLHVMRLYHVSYRLHQLDLFSEYVGQNVEDYIAARSEAGAYTLGTRAHADMMGECRVLVAQILDGVQHCHRIGLLLRDMKPRNCMIASADPMLVKLTGFALGRFASVPVEALTREVVTQCYRAPEILLGGPTPIYSAPVDI